VYDLMEVEVFHDLRRIAFGPDLNCYQSTEQNDATLRARPPFHGYKKRLYS